MILMLSLAERYCTCSHICSLASTTASLVFFDGISTEWDSRTPISSMFCGKTKIIITVSFAITKSKCLGLKLKCGLEMHGLNFKNNSSNL